MEMKKTLTIISLFTVVSSHCFERDYVSEAVLTKEQEMTISVLAKKCGLKEISKISTHNLFPSPFRSIRVIGVEQVKGSNVTFQVLNVSHNKWLPADSKPKKNQIQLGNFWAGKPLNRSQTILKVDKNVYRTNSIQGIKAEDCEMILSKLMSNTYDIGPLVNKDSLNQVNWAKPISFFKATTNAESKAVSVSVTFLHKLKDHGFFDLEIKIKGDKLIIAQILQAIP
jgi:hypothetical protein